MIVRTQAENFMSIPVIPDCHQYGAARDKRNSKPVQPGKPLAEESDAEHRYEDHTQLVDRCDERDHERVRGAVSAPQRRHCTKPSRRSGDSTGVSAFGSPNQLVHRRDPTRDEELAGAVTLSEL